MYKGDEPIKVFADFYKAKFDEVKTTRDEFYPDKNMLSLTRLGGIDQAMKDAIELKFIQKPLTKEQLDDMFKYFAK